MSYAIFKTGGKQYTVKKGDSIDVEKLSADEGETVVFDNVLSSVIGDEVKFGSPYIEGAKVKAKVVKQFRAKKVIAFKFKRRKGHHKTKGHRRHLTRLEITSI